jgi:hypothetical protein
MTTVGMHEQTPLDVDDELDERLGVDECELVADVETAELDLRSKVCQQ